MFEAGDRPEFVRLPALIAHHHGFSVSMSRYDAAMTLASNHIVSLLSLLVSQHSSIHWDGRTGHV
jgi:hypothetical protein